MNLEKIQKRYLYDKKRWLAGVGFSSTLCMCKWEFDGKLKDYRYK